MDFDHIIESITPNTTTLLTLGGQGVIIPSGTTATRPTAGTGLMRFNTDTNSLDIAINGSTYQTVQPVAVVAVTGITAAGTTQGTATQLTAAVNNVTTVASGTGVILQTPFAGNTIVVINRGANPLLVYPAVGGTIGTLAANTPITISVNRVVTLVATTTTQLEIESDTGASGTGTVTSVAATQPAAGITITGSPITTSGTLTFALSNDLAAVEGLSTTGIAVRTAADTWTTRTITGTAARLTVTNGDGVAGVPTLDIASTYVGQTSITTLGTITAGVWNGTSIANANLANASITIGSTTLALGATSTSLAGLTSVTSTTFVGALTGNSTSATNITGGTANQIPYQTAASTTLFFSAANYGVATYGATGTPASVAGAAGVLQGSASAIPVFTTTPTITGTNFSGIPNGALTNSSVTIGSTTIALGATSTSLAGLTTLSMNNQLTNSLATGTAPLVISSTTRVANLNVATAGTADVLTTPRAINGVNFDGSAAITVTAAAGTLTGATLNSSVTASSLTSLGTLTGLVLGGTTSTLSLNGSVGTSGQVLTSAGAGATPTWTTLGGGSGTVTSVTVTQPAAGITVTNSGVAQTPAATSTISLANDLAAVEGLATTGIAVRTASDTWTTRVDTGTANQITVTNGDGVAGNPTFSLPSAVTLPGSLVVTTSLATSVTSAIAAAGTTQGTATALTSDHNKITTATGGSATGVILPANTIGRLIYVYNDTAVDLTVYPPTGSNIDAAATNAGVTLKANGRSSYAATTSTIYSTNEQSLVAGSGITITPGNGIATIAATGGGGGTTLISAVPTGPGQDNWAPAGFTSSGAFLIKMQPTGPVWITGLTAGSNGQEVTLYNDSVFVIGVVHNAASTAANQFSNRRQTNWLLPRESCTLIYDTTISRWVVVGDTFDLLDANPNMMLIAAGGAATPTVWNTTVTNTATVASVAANTTPTNDFNEQLAMSATNATASGSAGTFTTAGLFARGATTGRGGIVMTGQAAFTALGATGGVMVGLTSSTAAITAQPSTLTNCILLGANGGQTTLRIFNGNAAAGTAVDLGANFPTPSATAAYEYLFHLPANNTTGYYMVRRLDSHFVAAGSVANSPVNTTLVGPRATVMVGGTATASTLQYTYMATRRIMR